MPANIQFVRLITSPAFKNHLRIFPDDLKESMPIQVMPDQVTRKSNAYLPIRFIFKCSCQKYITQSVINKNFRNWKLLILLQYLPGNRKNDICAYCRFYCNRTL